MKKPFQVGERVAVYLTHRHEGIIFEINDDCVKIESKSLGHGYHWIHYKACRRLTSKPKRQKVTKKQLEEWWREAPVDAMADPSECSKTFKELCAIVLGEGKL